MFWISFLSALCLAFLLVEKDEDWPISVFVPKIKYFLGFIHPKMPEMLTCGVCTAFWSALITDTFLFAVTKGSYFLWPISGFAAAGSAWMFYQLLLALEGDANASE